MIYIIKNFKLIESEKAIQSFQLSPSEAIRIQNKKKKEQSIFARYAASIGITKEFGLEKENITFHCNHTGQPIIQGQDICLSLAHTNNTVAAGINPTPIGVDLEYIRPYKERIVNRYFSFLEKQYVLSSSNKDYAFTQVWCLKESIAKLTGLGLSKSISNTNIFKDNCGFTSQNYDCYLKVFHLDDLIIGCAQHNQIPDDYIYIL